ncbi:MAG: glutathione S-transferase [Cereibacter sphaeroides]|uniref:Glutathione S-transferase n=1 Tax=Cereibacter sphaeroides TaxID=1063 RepID=A0A2W5RXP6_CERSP|nr:MAG: glutathione S-transferase [Cereibacter sphaeroides]
MLTLFHAPQSRSSRIITLIDEMGIADQIDIRIVDIIRQDGSGARDPANPHPEGKVPALVHDGTLITETPAVILYLTALFPDSGMAPKPGHPKRGEYLTWLHWYGGVMEPVLILDFLKFEHPALTATFRGANEVTARIAKALENGPYLLGDTYSAADLLIHSPYAFFGNTPDVPSIRDWVERCRSRPAVARTIASDAALMAKRKAGAAA